MVKSGVADERLAKYIYNLGKDTKFAIGLILGQPNEKGGPDFLIHFARTPPPRPSTDDKSDGDFRNLDQVNDQIIAEHAKHVTRKLPGGCYVLGVFIITTGPLLTMHDKCVQILKEIHKLLGATKYLYGNLDGTNQRIVLNYCLDEEKFNGHLIDIETRTNRPYDVKFQRQMAPPPLCRIECQYHVNETYNIANGAGPRGALLDWPIKKHMDVILEQVHRTLDEATYLFNGRRYESAQNLDDDIKLDVSKTKQVRKQQAQGDHKSEMDGIHPVHVTILKPCEILSDQRNFLITDEDNDLQILGLLVCQLFVQRKCAVYGIIDALKQDILRGLLTRLEMHCDSLTEEEHTEDVNSVHEPPRRVLIQLPYSPPMIIYDYLFPGEGEQEARAALAETFSIHVTTPSTQIQCIEEQAHLSDYYYGSETTAVETDSEEVLLNNSSSNNNNNNSSKRQQLSSSCHSVMRLLRMPNWNLTHYGILFAFIVLVIALLIHCLQGEDD